MEELTNHINGKRHQKALRNRNWFEAQQVKKLATVNGAHDDDEVRFAPPPAAAAGGGGSGSGTNAENDISNPGVPLAATAAAADGHDDDK
ncbi:hypothetical protein Pmar_PMAR024021 [Perkinsus marinus ATCC 50983]|uniref:U1-type domain-containing protein n=1 Tax=Perkinsus marinus (strain ATCC 50983 / TXsc) TaxID=423536 RepID=C5L6F6_PERM5|nr:hypothetical protein Pmar_PMAR024021 [Perkinsus marinus ATCC 50983]EER07617.1 hypothetical protein Pmar_PMAR024021 [Perkinsus marinus ATCC 50983]|eukprot:XP_002775801.1 hypothetical protein Pmar_PMAR024021 [Perkinsus marinus ATCC 50983]